jgi:hypothetical protein
MIADEGVEEVRARCPISEQTLEDVAHRLQLTVETRDITPTDAQSMHPCQSDYYCYTYPH